MTEDEVNQEMARTIDEYATTEHGRLAEIYRVNPILQSEALKNLLYDAARYRVSRRIARRKSRPADYAEDFKLPCSPPWCDCLIAYA
jgi:hypothetical protein